jgi:hypothetical protein
MMRMLLLLFVASATLSSQVLAEDACKSRQLKNPAPTLAEIYAMAQADAKAWKADVVPASIGNTSLGPLQPNGSSAAWNLVFYSEGAKATVSISTFRGTYRCAAEPGPAGRIPELKPDFMRDGARLYALAKEHGEALLGQGYTVMIGTAAAPSSRHATWYINYSKDNRNGNVTGIVDANSGLVEKVLKD